MSKRGSGRNESFWLWTGETEYEGQLLAVDGTRVLARVRRCGHWTPAGGSPGVAVPLDLNERTRHLSKRIGFGQSPAILSGTLIEFRVVAIQPTRDPHFEFTLSGTFWPVADEHLETLSRLNTNDAFRYLQKNSSRAYSPSRMQTG
jgi:hypothetical protein